VTKILRRGWHMFLCHSKVTIFPQLSTCRPVGRISLAMIYTSITQRVFVPQTMVMKPSLPPRQILHKCPFQELHKMFLSSTLMPS